MILDLNTNTIYLNPWGMPMLQRTSSTSHTSSTPVLRKRLSLLFLGSTGLQSCQVVLRPVGPGHIDSRLKNQNRLSQASRLDAPRGAARIMGARWGTPPLVRKLHLGSSLGTLKRGSVGSSQAREIPSSSPPPAGGRWVGGAACGGSASVVFDAAASAAVAVELVHERWCCWSGCLVAVQAL